MESVKGKVSYFETFGLCSTYKGEAVVVTYSSDITNDKKRKEQIVHAAEEARLANMSKNNFLANMNHQIQGSINAIVGMVNIGTGSPMPERKDYALGKIKTAADSVMHVLSGVLDMARIEAGRFKLNPDDYELPKLVQEVVRRHQAEIEEKRMTLVVKCDPQLPTTMYGDARVTDRVLARLMSNAVRYTPERGMVKVSASMVTHEGREMVQIDMEDTGIGIPEDRQDQIFEPFAMMDGTELAYQDRNGPGLALIFKLVELMGGKMWLKSTPGSGSIFSFTLPIARSAEI
jgi:two-component system sensor histidine kinase/response regulator